VSLVKASDVNDWKKLTRMIRHLPGSVEMPLILCPDSVPVPKWWVCGSHAMHPDMHGHTGVGCMSLGKGMPITTSTEQKLNTQSSAETELVAANDFMPIILWNDCFVEAQGYGHQDAVSHQDNQEAQFSSRRMVASQAASKPSKSIANSNSSAAAST
jgi:hypothetical protein